MPVTFRLPGMQDASNADRNATTDECVAFWRELHQDNAYFDQHRKYTDRLRPFGLDQIERLIEPTHSDVLLEIGCGYGRLLWHLAPRVRRAIGIDLSPEPLNEASRLLEGRGEIELHLGDGISLSPIKDASVDAAYAFTVFQPMSRSIALDNAREASRVLRPGGRFVLQLFVGDGEDDVRATPGEQSVGYTAAQACALIEDAGLRVTALEHDPLLDSYPAGDVAWWWLKARRPD